MAQNIKEPRKGHDKQRHIYLTNPLSQRSKGSKMKTNLRKSINKDLYAGMLLKDATMWQIVKHLYKRYTAEIWAAAFFISIAVDIYNKLGR